MALPTPESDTEGEDVDEGVDLKHTEEEDSEVLEGLSEEVPEEAHIGSEVWHHQTEGGVGRRERMERGWRGERGGRRGGRRGRDSVSPPLLT